MEHRDDEDDFFEFAESFALHLLGMANAAVNRWACFLFSKC